MNATVIDVVILNKIHLQLQAEQQEVSNREELCEFIKSITKLGNRSEEQWTGERNMVDMLEIVKRYYVQSTHKWLQLN